MQAKLFELALNIEAPFFIKDIRFDMEEKRLDIFIDFKRGSTFSYNDEMKFVKSTTQKKNSGDI